MLTKMQQFTHIRSLGSGGFGTTSLVEHNGKRFVLKQLKQSAIADHGATATDLFLQESEHLKTLGNHPQIPFFVGSGTNEDGPWILQQYIPGANLAQSLAHDGPMVEQEVIGMLRSLLPVVKFIHENGAIHRDIKPANIIFAENEYHLVDFGASKKVSETVLAKTGTTIGSAGFAAPEQTMGKAIYASDIYSLGVTCLNLLTGVDPFTLMNSATDEWDWRSFVVENPVSEGFGLILDKMIARATKKRYQSIPEVISALERIDRREIARQRVANIGKIRKRNAVRSFSVGVAKGIGACLLAFAVFKGGEIVVNHVPTVLTRIQPMPSSFSTGKCELNLVQPMFDQILIPEERRMICNGVGSLRGLTIALYIGALVTIAIAISCNPSSMPSSMIMLFLPTVFLVFVFML